MARVAGPGFHAPGSWSEVTSSDLEILRVQLGREPRRVAAVARRCRYGAPQVIVNAPLSERDGRQEIFPTLFWLTCPYLVKAVSALEGEGRIGSFRERLLSDEAFARKVDAAHAAHARLRLSLCPPGMLEELRRSAPEHHRVVAESGVGGMRRAEGVKCLHAHFADYLGRLGSEAENPIGAATAAMLLARGTDIGGAPGCAGCSLECGRGVRLGDRVASVDVGSNSVRLWIGEMRGGGEGLVTRVRRRVTTRLARGAREDGGGATGGAGHSFLLDEEAIAESIAALQEFARLIETEGAAHAGAATAAVRRAGNGGAFLQRVLSETGLSIPVITGEEEARLSFAGAVQALPATEPPESESAGASRHADLSPGASPTGLAADLVGVVDVGGGSTEIAVGTRDGDCRFQRSLPFGAVTLTERFVRSDPPAQHELEALEEHLRAMWRPVADELSLVRAPARKAPSSRPAAFRLIAVGGTAACAGAMFLEMEIYDPDKLHGTLVPKEALVRLRKDLAAVDTRARSSFTGLEPARADIIVAGLMVLESALESLELDAFTVSEAGLLQGLVWRAYPTAVVV